MKTALYKAPIKRSQHLSQHFDRALIHCKGEYLTAEETFSVFLVGSDLKSCRASLRNPTGEECELLKRSTPLTRSVAKKAARLGLSIIRQVSGDVGVFLYLLSSSLCQVRRPKGAVTLGSVSCNLSDKFVAPLRDKSQDMLFRQCMRKTLQVKSSRA